MKQVEALEVLKSGANVFLTGEPGAGKTYTINLFNEWANEKGIFPAITASTGIAATHISGVTIHSYAGIGIKEKITPHDINLILGKEYVVRRIAETEILIIDEISMLNASTLDNVDYVMREVRAFALDNDSLRGKAFGGVQVIFVGDFFQLPPVSKGTQAKFAFESQAWLTASPKICYLTEQHRQNDGPFLSLLTAMRAGKLKKEHKTLLVKAKRKAPKDITRLFTHNADVDRVNAEELSKLVGEKKTFRMRSSGIPFLVDVLKKNCLSPELLELKIGAPVMFTRNESRNEDGEGGRFVNGTLGVVEEMAGNFIAIRTKDDRRIVVNDQAEWSIEEHGQTKASIEQYPLRLAWAITVHKCQGMSLDAAMMDLSAAFEYGQGYVALSRVRSLEGLYLEGINAKALEMHPVVVKRDGMFRKLSGV